MGGDSSLYDVQSRLSMPLLREGCGGMPSKENF